MVVQHIGVRANQIWSRVLNMYANHATLAPRIIAFGVGVGGVPGCGHPVGIDTRSSLLWH